MDADPRAEGRPADEAGAPMFAWDEESHPLEASWGYQREFVPAMFRPAAEVVLSQVPPAPGTRVLDAGCGTGALALLAAELVGPGGSVAAVDLNPAQLAVASSLEGADAVEWREGDVADLPYEDGSFDAVYCQHVLQFLPDRVAALRELGRVAAPGAPVAVAVWGPIKRNPVFAALAAALEEHGDAETAAIVGSPRVFTDPDSLRAVVEEAGLDRPEVASFDVPVRMPSPAALLQELPPPLAGDAGEAAHEQRAAALAAAAAALEPLVGPGGLAFADQLHLSVAYAP